MVQALSDAIYARLAADPEVRAGLATYAGGPAVFTKPTVPPDVGLPYAQIRLAAQMRWDTLDAPGFDVTRDIALVGSQTASDAPMSALADRVETLFHDRPLDVEGYHVADVSVANIGPPPDEPGVNGRIVTLRALLRRVS